MRYQEQVKKITFEQIGLSSLKDGPYQGEYDADVLYARVQVPVESEQITEILPLDHKQERGKAVQQVLEEIVNQRKLDVEHVAGATNSSKMLKKAVENALQQAK